MRHSTLGLAALALTMGLGAATGWAQDQAAPGQLSLQPPAAASTEQKPMPRWFGEADGNSDGRVTREEVQALRQERIKGLDANSDGVLTAEEIVNFRVERFRQHMEEATRRTIEQRDLNGDGRLGADELAAGGGLPGLSGGAGAMFGAHFDRLDADGDGAVSKGEARAAMEKMHGRRGQDGRPGDHARMRGHDGPAERGHFDQQHGGKHGPHGGPDRGPRPPMPAQQ